MKRMKRWLALSLSLVMVLLFAACGGGSADDDWAYIQENGTLKIGFTYFEPMNYLDENGDFVGFETEFATAVCEKLGLEPEFVEINWDSKTMELESKSIDCIWNGMTIKDDLKENMDFSMPYSGNMQVCVINSANADVYTDLASMANAKIVVEAGSAGQSSVEAEEALQNAEVTTLQAQRDTLLELKSGTADVAVIDAVMAYASVGEGTSYADLMVVDGIELSKEEYGIGLRKGSDMTEKINEALQQLTDDGTVAALAEKYPSVLVTLEPSA